MEIREVHNPDAKLLIDYGARQERARQIMLRRLFTPWRMRKYQPDKIATITAEVDAIFRENARNYMKSAP